jgi:hypothetical protein
MRPAAPPFSDPSPPLGPALGDDQTDTTAPDTRLEDLAWPFTTDAKVLGDRLARGLKTEIMLVDLSGLDWPAIAPLVPLITSMAVEKDMVPVLVVDCADVLSVRRTGLPYDTLPDAAANAGLPDPMPGRDWPAYVARCRHLLAAKWQPAAIVHLGAHAEW